MARKGNKDRGLYPKGKGWGACWTDAAGELQRKAGFRTKTDAQAYLDKQRSLAYEEARLRAALLPWQWRMVELALHTGLRLREQLGAKGLRREWVYPTHITIPTPKGGQARHVPLNRRARELVAELLAEHDGPYLFPGRAGGSRARPYFSGEAAQKFLALACSDGSQAKPRSKYTSASRARGAERYANIPDFHWHDLRHTFCSRLVMAGVPLYWVRDLAGHKSITVTERYAHLAPGHLRQAVELLSPQEAVELLEGTGLLDRHSTTDSVAASR